MCTVTWLRHTDGYEIFFNRDELRTRLPAQPPALHEHSGVRFLAPTDGDKGGTWLGVNEFGLTLGLLNRYQDPFDRTREYDSRGWLVRDLLNIYDETVVAQRLAEMDLTRFPPFTLLIMTPTQTRLAHWNSDKLWWEADADACMPLSSSSYRAPEVIAARRVQFQEIAVNNELTPDFLRRFHHSHEPQTGPFAVCMHREDAHTVSFSHVKVDDAEIAFAYLGASPCVAETVRSETSWLTRRKGKSPCVSHDVASPKSGAVIHD